MKRLLTLLLASVLFGCGENYDDSALTGRVDDLENRVAQLEELCKQMNTNISSLQTLVTALQNSDCITAVTPIENGYTITFKQAAPPHYDLPWNQRGRRSGRSGRSGWTGWTGWTGWRRRH